MRLGKNMPKKLADLGGTFQDEPARPGSTLFLLGASWDPCETPLVENGGVYEDPQCSGASAIVDGVVEHLCAGLEGDAMEFCIDFLPNLEPPEVSEEDLIECGEEMITEAIIVSRDYDEQTPVAEMADEPVVRVNGKSLADYLDPAKRVSTGTVAREERLSKEKTNVFAQERGLRNLNKRNRGQKPYHYWIEHRRLGQKPAALAM